MLKDQEKRGIVRWLRPLYQVPRFGTEIEGEISDTEAGTEAVAPAETLREWPADAVAQLTAIRDALDDEAVTVDEVAKPFRRANKDDVRKHLATLEGLGVVEHDEASDRHRRLAGLAAAA